MSSNLPPAPPDDDDRERAWIVEGVRQALARASADELMRLISILEPVASGKGNVAGWLLMLVADEMGRQHLVFGGSAPRARAVADGGGDRGPARHRADRPLPRVTWPLRSARQSTPPAGRGSAPGPPMSPRRADRDTGTR